MCSYGKEVGWKHIVNVVSFSSRVVFVFFIYIVYPKRALYVRVDSVFCDRQANKEKKGN